jgi:hypothetical protein
MYLIVKVEKGWERNIWAWMDESNNVMKFFGKKTFSNDWW